MHDSYSPKIHFKLEHFKHYINTENTNVIRGDCLRNSWKAPHTREASSGSLYNLPPT